jgi:hypothetical protein
MFIKKLLSVGLVAAFGTSTAFAADFDLDSATAAARGFALETLDSTDATTVSSTAYPNVNSAAAGLGDLDVTGLLGVGVGNTEDLFIRYNLTNGFFGAAPGLTAPTSSDVVVQGGTTGASFVIFQVTATADIAQTGVVVMSPTKLAAKDVASPIGVSMTVYETLTQATSEGTSLVSKSKASYVTLASGLKATIAAAAAAGATAEVEGDFKKFTTGAISTTLALTGSGTIGVVTGTAAADDGAQVAIGDMINTTTSTVVISGDFSVTTNSVGIDSNVNCATALAALTPNTAKTAASSVTVAALNAKPNLCYTAAGTTAIPEGSYTAAATLVATATTRTNQTTSLSGTIGSVAHNGTTVQLPYLTTFSDYNQRLVMVNRSAATAAYSTSFQTEAGVTATAGTASTGTIPAGGSLVVKVSDVVTLTGGTRAAGTVSIVAASAKISVATTQVNLSDASTDTISLQ